MTKLHPGPGPQAALEWATLATSVARCLQQVEARTGVRPQLVELRPTPGRVVNLKIGYTVDDQAMRETLAIEVPDLSPEEAVRAIPHVIAFIDAASSRELRKSRVQSRITSSRRPSREARRTSEPQAQRRRR